MTAAERIIRRLNPGEAELYREIRLRSLADSPQAFGTTHAAASQRDAASWAAQADEAAQSADRAIFIVLVNGGAIGLAGLYRDPGTADHGDLIQMWIAPEWRGSGAGKDLLGGVFAWAAAHSIRVVRAEIMPGNAVARRFYGKEGFRPGGMNSGNEVLVRMPEIRIDP